MQNIEVTIDKDGRVIVHVMGVTGPRCLELTEALEGALGETESVELTSEAFDGDGGETGGVQVTL